MLNSVVSWNLNLFSIVYPFLPLLGLHFVYSTTDVNSVLIIKVLIPFSLQLYKSKVILLK